MKKLIIGIICLIMVIGLTIGLILFNKKDEETIKLVKDHIDMCVSGSYICLSNDYEKQIEKLRK